MELLQRGVSFSVCHSITTTGRVILLDEPMVETRKAALSQLPTIDGHELLFLESSDLATDFEQILGRILADDANALLVFPGNGSRYPREWSPLCAQATTATVFAKRYWSPGINPIVTTGLILPERFLVMDVRTVVVVDDVISSGRTLRNLHRNNAWRFPRAQWLGASWVTQAFGRSGIPGYTAVAASRSLARPSGGRVPINSISTLRHCPEIARNYAGRHFNDPERFLELLD